jgi:hypothetical protein
MHDKSTLQVSIHCNRDKSQHKKENTCYYLAWCACCYTPSKAANQLENIFTAAQPGTQEQYVSDPVETNHERKRKQAQKEIHVSVNRLTRSVFPHSFDY